MGTEPGPQLEPTLRDSISRSPVLDSLLPHQEPHSGPASSHRPLSFISGPGSQPFLVPAGVPSLISPRPFPVPPSGHDLVPSVQRSPLPKVAAISVPSQQVCRASPRPRLKGKGGKKARGTMVIVVQTIRTAAHWTTIPGLHCARGRSCSAVRGATLGRPVEACCCQLTAFPLAAHSCYCDNCGQSFSSSVGIVASTPHNSWEVQGDVMRSTGKDRLWARG